MVSPNAPENIWPASVDGVSGHAVPDTVTRTRYESLRSADGLEAWLTRRAQLSAINCTFSLRGDTIPGIYRLLAAWLSSPTALVGDIHACKPISNIFPMVCANGLFLLVRTPTLALTESLVAHSSLRVAVPTPDPAVGSSQNRDSNRLCTVVVSATLSVSCWSMCSIGTDRVC